MNSYNPKESMLYKRPFGLQYELQNEILNQAKDVFLTMKCSGKRTNQVFQKGLIISITSLQLLFNFLKEKYNTSYIITHRLNQDILENFFSQVKYI